MTRSEGDRRRAGTRNRSIAGVVRLVHPFPSILDAVCAGVVALLAGGAVSIAARLAGAMLGLQFAIGATNDLVDEPSDRIAGRRKPLVVGDVPVAAARLVVALGLLSGLFLAASVGVTALALGALGVSDGMAYNLWLKRSPLAWLPWALGVGLLPAYGWAGASGCVSPTLAAVVALAVVGGAALALANALADLAHDEQAGIRSVASLLGRRRTVAINVLLIASAQAAAVSWTIGLGLSISAARLAVAAELTGVAITWAGLDLVASTGALRPQRGWELQAVGLAVTGFGLIAALVEAGSLRPGAC